MRKVMLVIGGCLILAACTDAQLERTKDIVDKTAPAADAALRATPLPLAAMIPWHDIIVGATTLIIAGLGGHRIVGAGAKKVGVPVFGGKEPTA